MATGSNTAGLGQRFEALRREQKRSKEQILTRVERAEREKELATLEEAAQYTVGGIVTGLAELRLEVSGTVSGLEARLERESEKLETLQKAVVVAKGELEALDKVRTAADALYVLQQESAEKTFSLEREHTERLAVQDREVHETRERWTREESEFQAARKERELERTRRREGEETAFAYTLEQNRKKDSDRHSDAERTQTRALSEQGRAQDKTWAEREAVLERETARHAENLTKLEGFPAELEAAVKKAREDALRDAGSEAKVKSDLLEKEWDAGERSFELQIESLQTLLTEGEKQLLELQAQLQATLQQAQLLAGRAFRGDA